MSESTSDRDPVERLAAEFAERLRRGEHPSLTEYVERYPELADDIRDLFPALFLVEQFKPAQAELGVPSAASSPPARGDIPSQLGDYRIIRYLGEGGMGVVYEAVRKSLSCHVALKVMHPQFRNREKYLRRFRTEARSAARLHHTNIVSVFDYGDHDGVCYYAMQFIAGQSLDKVLTEVRRLRQAKPQLAAAPATTVSLAPGDALQEAGVRIHSLAGHDLTELAPRSIAIGLMTGRFEKAAPGALNDDEAATQRPNAANAVKGATETNGSFSRWARTLARGITPTESDSGRILGGQGRGRGRDGGVARSAVNPAPEPPPVCGGSADATVPPEGTTNVLTIKSDRYYREVARLVSQLADALAYAHDRGVIHRDIKPPNLILDPLGNVWVTDFGLAKFEDVDEVSHSREVAGTLRYMAPERFRGISDRRCDIYSLGATLYELLSLKPPFEDEDQLRLIYSIENATVPALRQIDPRIPRDLETIVHKAMARNPDDRFRTAGEMREELRRYLENRPLLSRPIPLHHRFGRWCQRNRKLAASTITAAVLLVLLAAVSTWAAVNSDIHARFLDGLVKKLSVSEKQAQAAKIEAREQLFGALSERAHAGRLSRRVGQRIDSLAALHEAVNVARELKLPGKRLDPLRDEAIACMALPDMKPAGQPIRVPDGTSNFAFNEGMTRYAIRLRDGTILVYRMDDNQEIARFKGEGDRDIFVFAFSPDGRYLASEDRPSRALSIWQVDRKALCLRDPGPVSGIAASFSPDSQHIAVARIDRSLVIYSLKTGKPIKTWHGLAPGYALAYRPDGKRIAVVYRARPAACQILDASTGRLLRAIASPGDGESVAWSADGTTLATTSGRDATILLWDAASGQRRAILQGATNGGLRAAFHPSGTLLATSGWEYRLRLWDAVLGHQILNVSTAWADAEFSRDGRIFVSQQNEYTPWKVEPALEYRTLAHLADQPLNYARAEIQRDGRILAVGTDRGVVLWDLARGTELAFLEIGLAWHSMFDVSGDLLTNGQAGFWRWPVHIDAISGALRIGPPSKLPLPGTDSTIAEDRTGRVVAVAAHDSAYVALDGRMLKIGPLDDCRYVSVSPDGHWLATGSHITGGVTIWKLPEGSQVAGLSSELSNQICFSPDGRWIMTRASPCRLYQVGTWRELRRFDGTFHCFSPDSRLAVTQDVSRALILIEIETGRTLARFESPDRPDFVFVTFSPDGSRLAVTTNDPPPCVHVWDLRTIRRRLGEMGLDWNAPPFSDEDPASSSAPPLAALEINYGQLRPVVQQQHDNMSAVPAEDLVTRYTERLRGQPADSDALHRRGHALLELKRYDQALADFTAASELLPSDAHLLAYRGISLFNLKRYGPAIDQLEAVFRTHPDSIRALRNFDQVLNNVAWLLATGPELERDAGVATRMAALSVALVGDQQTNLTALGVALYRAGKFAEAVQALDKSLVASKGQFDAFDLFFLAMGHHRLGHRTEARNCYDRAVRWMGEHRSLSDRDAKQLTDFRSEAETVLAEPPSMLPVEVFAPR
jgi:serine/threonine protein kinase/WD40 repeat protein/Flp pilus assembly protein TadD